jgi:copper(I)-binding protein
MHRTPIRTFLASAAVAALLAGCASSPGGTTSSPAPEASPSAPGMAADGAAATVGELELAGFWVKQSSLDLSAGFGTITNSGSTDDALVSFSAPGVPTTEIHTTQDGVMQQIPQLPVPAGGTAVMAPMGDHLMLIGLTSPLEPGTTVPLTLTFASGSTVTLEAPVKAFTGGTGHGDGDDHGHGGDA